MPSQRLKNLDRACLIILAVAALSGTAWNVSAVVSRERGLRQKTELRNQTLRQMAQAERTKKTLEQATARVHLELTGLKKRIPPKTDLGALLRKLNRRMKERRVTVTAIQPLAAVQDELYLKIPIRLVFQGSFQQSYLFLYDLEGMEPLLVPEKAIVTGLEPPKECQVDLTLFLFERRAAESGG